MGFLIAIFNALTVAASDVFVKKLRGENKFFLIWLRMAGAAPVLALLVTIFSSWEIPPSIFWWLILGINVPIEVLQFYIGYTAIQISPLSLVAPLSSFTSLFLIPVSYIVLGESPTLIAFIGVCLIVAGTFFLGWEFGKNMRMGDALKKVFSEKGSWLVLTAALLVTVPITTAKYTFRFASPLLTAFYIVVGLVVALTPFALWKKREIAEIPTRKSLLGGLSVVSGLSLGLHYTGLSLLPAVYYISVKRFSMVFNVIFGKTFFQEENIRERLIGAAFMVGGAIMIALG